MIDAKILLLCGLLLLLFFAVFFTTLQRTGNSDVGCKSAFKRAVDRVRSWLSVFDRYVWILPFLIGIIALAIFLGTSIGKLCSSESTEFEHPFIENQQIIDNYNNSVSDYNHELDILYQTTEKLKDASD